jgi:hypothetical protein
MIIPRITFRDFDDFAVGHLRVVHPLFALFEEHNTEANQYQRDQRERAQKQGHRSVKFACWPS